MAKKGKTKKRAKSSEPATSDASIVGEELRRIANLLALLAVKGEDQKDKVLTLSAAGYQPAEIASLLDTTANTVRVTLSQSRSTKKKKKRSKRNDSR